MRPKNVSLSNIFLNILIKGSVFIILFIIIAVLSSLSDSFFTLSNLTTVALQTSLIAIVAIGMTFAIISGGIDLSVGSVAALCGALAAGLATRQGMGTFPAILIALTAGASLGAINGALIVFGQMPPFVATLAMMAGARGLTLVYTQGRPIAGLDSSFTFLAGGNLLGIPVPVLFMLALAVCAHLILTQTAYGLHIYAVGGSEETARLASVPVQRIKMGVYIISGLCAASMGILITSRLWSAQPNTGILLELDAITSAILGGASLAGGAGNIGGTIAGAFILGALSNGLNLLAVPSFTQQVVKGVIFIVAVLLDYLLKRRLQAGIKPPAITLFHRG